MHELLRRQRLISWFPTPTNTLGGAVDFNATGDKWIYSPACKSSIYRFGYITDSAHGAGATAIVLDLRPTAGTDTGRVTKATLTNTAAVAAGKLVYADVAIPVAQATAVDGSKTDVDPTGPLDVQPGQQVVLKVSVANGAAATGYLFIETLETAFEKSNANVTKITAT